MVAEERKITGYYPVSFKIRGIKCVVVGGGGVALRKVKALLECGAHLTVVSPKVSSEVLELAEGKAIRLIHRRYRTADLKNAAIVIAATDDRKVNRKVAGDAKKVRAWVNVVDDPEPSDFIVPSVVRRGDLTIAISTGGMSPALARKIRTRLEDSFGEEYALLVSLVEEVRSTLRRRGIRVNAERWQNALDLDFLAQLLRTGQKDKAKAVLMKKLKKTN